MKLALDFDEKHRLAVADDFVEFRLRQLAVEPGTKVDLKKKFDPDFTGGYTDKTGALEHVAANVERMADLQAKLYAQSTYALLIVLQAMDAAGKDGVIRHVMSGVNPQGCQVTSFKSPSTDELSHDYLWRSARAMPRRGMIGVFNRSYYEEVLVVRVRPEFLAKQNLPPADKGEDIWQSRFEEIRNFEKYLTNNGILIAKFFLNVSRSEQRKRFIARIDEPDKNWKFSEADVRERKNWKKYQSVIEDMLENTSTDYAPWFVIPADTKWFARLAVSEIICSFLERLDLKFPTVTDARRAELAQYRKELLAD